MGILFWLIFGIIAIFLLLVYIVKAFMNGQIWIVLKFLIILSIILFLYYFAAIFLQGVYISIFPTAPKNKNMELWDNVWYALLAIFLTLMSTVFIKSLKKNDLQFKLVMNALGSFTILSLFSVLYYFYLYDDYINKITLILTIASFGMTAIVLLIQYFNISNVVTSIIFVIYGILLIVYFMALLFFVYDVLSNVYDFLI